MPPNFISKIRYDELPV